MYACYGRTRVYANMEKKEEQETLEKLKELEEKDKELYRMGRR